MFYELTNEEIELLKKIGQIKIMMKMPFYFMKMKKQITFILFSGLAKGGIFENKKRKNISLIFSKNVYRRNIFLEEKTTL